jgi:phenylacetic acid degradation protein paaN
MTQATKLASDRENPVHPYLAAHRETLDRARQAIAERSYWSAYPESPSPKVYGETAAADGAAAFQARLGADFPLDQPGTTDWVATEASPFGIELGVRYPHPDIDVLLAAAQAAIPAWRDAGPQIRVGVCAEILHRIHQNIFELANAVQFTTGQAFVMAFQAGGAHALDRALEAIAYAEAEMTRTPASAAWSKPASKGDPLSMTKQFHVVPRGVALVIGCNTFPTWNAYPGLFASLATGNAVVIKPHPRAVLPLAITAGIARSVLADAGFDPNLVTLAAEQPGEGLAKTLATRPEVRIIDYTGSTEFGEWLERNAQQAAVYTEKAGVNTVVVDSTDDFAGMCRNLGFSLTLYSGQMCTTPQNILVPAGGIQTDQGHKSFEDVAGGIAAAVSALTADPARGVELTGAIVNDGVLERIDRARQAGQVVTDSATVTHPAHAEAVVRTPLILRTTVDDEKTISTEWFGPISFVVATKSTEDSIALFRRTAGTCGAITAAVYSTDEKVLDAALDAALDAGVHLSCNLTGGVFVNQSAAFSDFHASGANPAANATLTDGAFVAGRFRVVQSRRHS